MTRPIIPQQLETEVLDAIAQYQNRNDWILWGLEKVRKQGSAILLKGPPGCGKNTIARWVANKVGRGWKELDAGTFAGGEPGECERGLHKFFDEATQKKATIVIDECDNLLLSRDKIGEAGSTWQLGTIECLMTRMNVYPYLILAMTNHPQLIDPALSDRFIAIIHVGEPDELTRRKLWDNKIPPQFPWNYSEGEICALAKFKLTGRQIENVIVRVGQHCIRARLKPSFHWFEHYAKIETKKNLK